ncbi:hypothetical protein K9L16_00710 [Candidatus Pacearchaeota archaeon]|nr:hypothetical protein [Candidatus Pacearchaeota archaeon]
MDSILYPTFEINEITGILPRITLPRNFKELIPKFYKQRRQEVVENYASKLEQELDLSNKILLQWNEERGLTNISLGTAGLDLNETGIPKLQSHNIGNNNAIPLGFTAMKYVSELLKSK